MYPNKVMDKAQAMQLKRRAVLHHVNLRNADSTPLRARVNGKIKLWKHRPEFYMLPMKHGLKDRFYLEPNNERFWYDSRVQNVNETA